MVSDVLSFSSKYFWLVQIACVIILAFFLLLVEGWIYRRMQPRFSSKGKIWGASFLQAVHLPIIALVWALALTFVIQTAAGPLDVTLSVFDIARVQQLLVVLTVFWFAMRFIRCIEAETIKKNQIGRRKLDQTSTRAIGQILRIVVVVISLLVIMSTFGIPISALLAFGGVGGIALGFAAKDSLANFFGGMMIFMDRPFSVGDWVRSPDRNIEGTVEEIGWRLTRIRTFDKRPLYVPNGIFSTIIVENPSRMRNRRIKTTIGLRYDDASVIPVVLKDIETMLKNHPDIDTTQTLMVNLCEFADSSLNFFIYTFTKTTNWVKFQAIQQDVFLKILAIIAKHGAECAFPTRTVHWQKDEIE